MEKGYRLLNHERCHIMMKCIISEVYFHRGKKKKKKRKELRVLVSQLPMKFVLQTELARQRLVQEFLLHYVFKQVNQDHTEALCCG